MVDSGLSLLKNENVSTQAQPSKPPLSRKTSPCIVITSAAEDLLSNSQTSNTASDTTATTTTATTQTLVQSVSSRNKQSTSNQRRPELTQYHNLCGDIPARSAVTYHSMSSRSLPGYGTLF